LREILIEEVFDPKLTWSSFRFSAASGLLVRGLIGSDIPMLVQFLEGDFSAILA
jgi:hypothetical protein